MSSDELRGSFRMHIDREEPRKRQVAVIGAGGEVIAIGGEWGTLSEIGFARVIAAETAEEAVAATPRALA